MKTSTESWRGRIALMVAHCAGMVDLVALPVWVGALIAQYRFTPPQAGGLATLFLVGAVLSSLFFAPRFNRIDAPLSGDRRLRDAAVWRSWRRRSFPTSRLLPPCISIGGASQSAAR